MDSAEGKEQALGNPEIEFSKPGKIHLEFGNHSLRSRGFIADKGGPDLNFLIINPDEVEEKFKLGDLNAHHWNPQVSERMRSYDPDILVADSQRVRYNEGDYTLDQKKDIWTWLPDRPKNINHKGEVLVVAADVFYSTIPGSEELEITNDLRNKAILELNKSKNQAISTIVRNDYLLGTFTPFFLGLTIPMLIEPYLSRNKNVKMSRRRFLRGVTIGSAAVAAEVSIGKGSAFMASIFGNEKAANIAEYVANVSNPFATSEAFIDGRTALLIAKCIDAKNQGLTQQDADSAVVLGRDHIFHASDLLNNPEKRINTIANYYKEAIAVLHKTCDKFTELPRQRLIEGFTHVFSNYDILSVTDTEEDRVENVDEFINDHVKLVGNYVSTEVLEAIRRVKPDVDTLVKTK